VLLCSLSQIFYSIMDLTLFGEQSSKPMDTISTVADLRRKHTSGKYAEGTHWHTRFTHLVTYGAGKCSSCALVPELPHSSLLIDYINYITLLQATIPIYMLDVLPQLYGKKYAKKTRCPAVQAVPSGTNSCGSAGQRTHHPC
jgi:hypothetical protein